MTTPRSGQKRPASTFQTPNSDVTPPQLRLKLMQPQNSAQKKRKRIPSSKIRESLSKGEFWVRTILDEKDGLYLISWEGYSDEANTWEPRKNIGDAVIQEWEKRKLRQHNRKHRTAILVDSSTDSTQATQLAELPAPDSLSMHGSPTTPAAGSARQQAEHPAALKTLPLDAIRPPPRISIYRRPDFHSQEYEYIAGSQTQRNQLLSPDLSTPPSTRSSSAQSSPLGQTYYTSNTPRVIPDSQPPLEPFSAVALTYGADTGPGISETIVDSNNIQSQDQKQSDSLPSPSSSVTDFSSTYPNQADIQAAQAQSSSPSSQPVPELQDLNAAELSSPVNIQPKPLKIAFPAIASIMKQRNPHGVQASVTDDRATQATGMRRGHASRSNKSKSPSSSGSNGRRPAAIHIAANDGLQGTGAIDAAMDAASQPATNESGLTQSESTTSLAVAQGDGSADDVTKIADSVIPRLPRPNGESANHIFVIPMNLLGSVSQRYCHLFRAKADAIERFASAPAESAVEHNPLNEEMRALLVDANNISTHIDLLSPETLTQEDSTDEARFLWASTISSKFLCLKCLCESTQGTSLKNIAVCASPGYTLNLLESFFKGMNVTYRRPETSTYFASTGNLSITILSTDPDQLDAGADDPDLIIGLDSTFSPELPVVKDLRSRAEAAHRLGLMVRFVVINSVEHVKRSLPETMSGAEKFKTLVCKSTELRNIAGNLTPGLIQPADAGRELAHYFNLSSTPADWPFVDLLNVDVTLPSMTQTTRSSPTRAAGTSKRTLESGSESENHSNKRSRVGPPQYSLEITQSSSEQSSVSQATQDSMHSTVKGSLTLKELDVEVSRLTTSLADHIEALEAVRAASEANALENRTMKAKIATLEQSLESAETRRDTTLKHNAELRTENSRLRSDLKKTNALLAASEDAAVAEIGQNKVDQDKLEAAEKQVASMNKDFDFMREQHQKASSMAAELAAEVADLKEANAKLSKKASGETLKLQQMHQLNYMSQAKDAALRSIAEIKNLRRICAQKDDEIEQLRKKEAARVLTRAASMGPLSGVVTPGAQSARSRAAAGVPANGIGGSAGGSGSRSTSRSRIGTSRQGSRQASPLPPSSTAPAVGSGARLLAQHALGGRHGRG